MNLPDLLQGVPLSGYEPDAISAASARIRSFCDWHIAPVVTETVVLPPLLYGVLFLPSLRVTAVTEVTVGGVATSWFRWSPTGRVELRSHPYGTHDLDVSVTFTHGFDVCPEDVRATVAKLAKSGFVPEPTVKSETETKGPFTTVTTYSDGADEFDGVAAYRRVFVA